MPIQLASLDREPHIPATCYVDVSARINGDVTMGEHCSVWFHAAIRGDVNHIRIGNRTNIQDHCTMHTTYKQHALQVGDDVTFGHGVVAHGCQIGSRVLLGMHSIIMDGVQIGDDVIIGAGSLVTEGKVIPAGVLAYGRPARVKRELTAAERAMLVQRAQDYVSYVRNYQEKGLFCGWKDNLFRKTR